MKIVEAKTDSAVRDAAGQPVYHQRAGMRYVLYDCEALPGVQAGAVRLVETLNRYLPCYTGGALARQRLLVPFIGRGGDAVVLASCIEALKEQYPQVQVEVAAPSAAREVFVLTPAIDQVVDYPVPADTLNRYDYYLSFEGVESVPNGSSRSLADALSCCVHTPRPTHPPRVVVPESFRIAWQMADSSRRRVALHGGHLGTLRAYPPDRVQALASLLARHDFEVYLIGRPDPRCDFAQPSYPRGVFDLTGRTPTCTDLAAVLLQMAALVTCDGLPLHLAGALGIPTVALFGATDSVLASDYPHVIAVQAPTACSPCREATGRCPLNHRACVAQRDVALAPRRLSEMVEEIVAGARSATHT